MSNTNSSKYLNVKISSVAYFILWKHVGRYSNFYIVKLGNLYIHLLCSDASACIPHKNPRFYFDNRMNMFFCMKFL